MTPEQAFEKWWSSRGPHHVCTKYGTRDIRDAFLAGQEHQETNQLMVLADIRKAVGDGEGRLSQEELVERIRCLVKANEELQNTLDRAQIVVASLSSAVSAATEKEEA